MILKATRSELGLLAAGSLGAGAAVAGLLYGAVYEYTRFGLFNLLSSRTLTKRRSTVGDLDAAVSLVATTGGEVRVLPHLSRRGAGEHPGTAALYHELPVNTGRRPIQKAHQLWLRWVAICSTIIDSPDSLGGIVTIPLASDDKDAKERVSRLVAELGFDPVDFGTLRLAHNSESRQMIYMIPLMQIRTEEWEFYFRRNAHWVCQWGTDWSEPVYDSGDLAVMAEKQDPPIPCQ